MSPSGVVVLAAVWPALPAAALAAIAAEVPEGVLIVIAQPASVVVAAGQGFMVPACVSASMARDATEATDAVAACAPVPATAIAATAIAAALVSASRLVNIANI